MTSNSCTFNKCLMVFKVLVLYSIILNLVSVSPVFASPSEDNVGTSIAYSSLPAASADSIASALSIQQAEFSSIPAIPLPSTIPGQGRLGSDALAQLAEMMPPLQQAQSGGKVSDRNVDRMLAEMQPDSPSNTSQVAASKRASGLRVMIVGDSMTQGAQGDYTWRFRIWQWLQSEGADVEFVGPYLGTLPPPKPSPPSPPPLYGSPPPPPSPPVTDGGYAVDVSPSFNSHHFAVWGRAAATDKSLIAGMVRQYPTDMILLMLGFNDLGWFYSGPTGTLDSIYELIENARGVNPNMKFAVANIPQRTSLNRRDLPANTNTYNNMLSEAIPYWTTTQSPIGLVYLRENYDCNVDSCPAGYDGLHPNALGEYQIAQAFSKTLVANFSLGNNALVIPSNIPPRPVPVPSNFKVQASPGGITATWDAVYGAYSYDVQSRIQGLNWSTGSVTSNRYDQTWPVNNLTYDIMVRTSCGNTIKGDWTAIGSATAFPKTAPAPLNIHVTPTSDGVDVSWDPPTGPYTDSIIEYNIITWDLDTDCAIIQGAAFLDSPAHITGLVPGHRYMVAPETWNANGEGLPEVVHYAIPGDGTPAPPTGLKIVATDPTSVYMTWDSMPNAAGYVIWYNDVNNKSSTPMPHNGSVTTTCFEDFYLYPGTWNYEYCIQAYNGDNDSKLGKCVTAPHPSNQSLSCPTPPGWCADGGQLWGPAPEPPGPIPGITVTPIPSHVITTTVSGFARTETILTTTITGSNGKTTPLTETIFPTTVVFVGKTRTVTETIVVATTTGTNGTPTKVTETILPFWTTNADGSTVLSTSTEGPPIIGPLPTFNTSVSLITYTKFPPITVTTYQSHNYNDHTTSTGSNGKVTPIPIVGGGGCWFCPNTGPDGYGLGGLGPGVYPPGPAPPGWPTPLPPITVEPNGEPEYSDEPTQTSEKTKSSSSSTCKSTATATDIVYYVSYLTNSDGSTTKTTTYSTASAVTRGCDVRAETTTRTEDISADVTPAPVAIMTSREAWPTSFPDDAVIFSGAQLVLQRLSGYGDFAPATTTPTTTSSSSTEGSTSTQPPFPTGTTREKLPAYCYSPGNYYGWSNADGSHLSHKLCNAGYTLTPGQTYPYVESYTDSNGVEIFAEVGYSSNQTNCRSERQYVLNYDGCLGGFDAISKDCAAGHPRYGGGLVISTGGGCIFWSISAPKQLTEFERNVSNSH